MARTKETVDETITIDVNDGLNILTIINTFKYKVLISGVWEITGYNDISPLNLLILEFTQNSIICKIIQNLSHHFFIIFMQH